MASPTATKEPSSTISSPPPPFISPTLTSALLPRLQSEDRYHILTHERNLRPDLLTESEEADANKAICFIKLHRFLPLPYFRLRRRTFKHLRDSGQLAPEGLK